MKKMFTVSNHGQISAGACRIGFVLLFGVVFGFAFWTATAAPPGATPTPTLSPTPTPGRGHQECTVCHNVQHNPHTITIDCHALQAHLAHGDYTGPCQVTQVTNP